MSHSARPESEVEGARSRAGDEDATGKPGLQKFVPFFVAALLVAGLLVAHLLTGVRPH
jgi:hypothetical protein